MICPFCDLPSATPDKCHRCGTSIPSRAVVHAIGERPPYEGYSGGAWDDGPNASADHFAKGYNAVLPVQRRKS